MIVEIVIKAVELKRVVGLAHLTHHEAIELLVIPAGATILPGGGLRENGDLAFAYDDGKDSCTIELGSAEPFDKDGREPIWFEEAAEISVEVFSKLEGTKDIKRNKVIG